MSSFIYPDSRVRKLYGVQGNIMARRRFRIRKDAEAQQRDRERLIAESKAKVGPKQNFVTKAFTKIRNLFKRS